MLANQLVNAPVVNTLPLEEQSYTLRDNPRKTQCQVSDGNMVVLLAVQLTFEYAQMGVTCLLLFTPLAPLRLFHHVICIYTTTC
jgi:hypothetical protein